MRYYLDTEFIDNGKTIDLISIGIAAEDGRELYLQSCEFDPKGASVWVRENVFPHLSFCPRIHYRGKPSVGDELIAHERGHCTSFTSEGVGFGEAGCFWRTREQIANEVRAFCDPGGHGKPEIWGWCAGYDWVALCHLFGTMMDLPAGWPHYIRDIQQILDERGIADEALPPQPENAHNALADAQYIKLLWDWLRG